jgi:hypothetical protein
MKDAPDYFIGKTISKIQSGIERNTRFYCALFEFTDGSSFWFRTEEKIIFEFIEGNEIQ